MLQNSNNNEKPCFLIAWSLTGKRGRQATIHDTSTTTIASSSSSSSEDHETAHFLLMLSSTTTTTTTSTTDHRCESCGKTFASHQALGGHRSSHVKVKKTRIVLVDVDDEDDDDGERKETVEVFDRLSIDADGVKNKMKKKKKHECSICNKRFSSGQALGGHKRRHWDRKPAAAALAAPNNNNNHAETNKKKRKKKEKLISSICFDLNLPPPPLSSDEVEDENFSTEGSSPAYPLMPYC